MKKSELTKEESDLYLKIVKFGDCKFLGESCYNSTGCKRCWALCL